MSNFDFILNIDNSKRISNTDTELCYDNSYISYFRVLSLKEPLNIIKNALLKKIIEKQIIYKNSEYLEQINNCLDYSINNLKNLNENIIYSNKENEEINKVIDFIINENEKTDTLIENKIIKYNNQTKDAKSLEENITQTDLNESNIHNSENSESSENSDNNYSLFDKLCSIVIKIKNAVQSGFKISYNYISTHSSNFINNIRNNQNS